MNYCELMNSRTCFMLDTYMYSCYTIIMVVIRKWAEFATSPAPRSGTRFYVSLNPRGIIAMNRRAYAALGEPEAVNLLFDIDNLTIGLRPCGLLMPNAFVIAQR